MKKHYTVSELSSYAGNIASIIRTFTSDRYDLEYLFGKQVFRYGDMREYRYQRVDGVNVAVLFDTEKGKLSQVQLSAVPIEASRLLKSPCDNIEDIKSYIARGKFTIYDLTCYSCAEDARRVVLDDMDLDTILHVTFVKDFE